MMKRIDPAKRFWAKVQITDGCWIWKGTILSNGYGKFDIGYRQGLAHRFAYELLVGSIPEGMQVDHLCHNIDLLCVGRPCLHRRCVNPAHLEAVSPKANTLRSRNPAAKNAQVTACPKGHPYDEVNTLVGRKGNRRCRTCERAWSLRYQRAKRQRTT